jgi:hypothetical protein
MNGRPAIELPSEELPLRDKLTPAEAAEELRLWADYYEATARALEIMRAEGTTAATLVRIVAEDARASAAIERIKEIRGLRH